MKLSEIAYLQSGLVLNRKEAHFPEETIKIYRRLNLRSLNKSGTIEINELDVYPSKELLDPSMLTQKNDVVVKLFSPIYPTLITDNDIGLVIPSQLVVIRIINENILPAYLRYWLSTPEVSDFMLSLEGWRSQRTINISTFADLDVPIPSMEKQQAISNIVSLNIKRETLYHQLIEEQNRLTALSIQIAMGGKR